MNSLKYRILPYHHLFLHSPNAPKNTPTTTITSISTPLHGHSKSYPAFASFNLKSRNPLAVACLVSLVSKAKSFFASLEVLILGSELIADGLDKSYPALYGF